MSTEFLENLEILISKYDLFLVDLWGVTHDGVKPFKGALNFFKYCKAKNKKIVFLSNAPRLPYSSVARLNEMGVTCNLYDNIYTSGLDCFTHLKERPCSFYQSLGRRLYHYGPSRDKSLLDGLNSTYEIVNSYQESDFILMSSTLNWNETLECSKEMLGYALKNNISIISANADHIVLREESETLCVGAIAQVYKEMGGKTYIHGKPDPNIFYQAHCFAPEIDKSKILMIGDSLRTDIKGAQSYGIDSLMVLTGIFKNDFKNMLLNPDECLQKVSSLASDYGAYPTYLSRGLR